MAKELSMSQLRSRCEILAPAGGVFTTLQQEDGSWSAYAENDDQALPGGGGNEREAMVSLLSQFGTKAN